MRFSLRSRRCPKQVPTALMILLGCIIAGYFALAGAYGMPMGGNAALVGQSVATMREEGMYPHVGSLSETHRRDNYTDALMLSEAYYDGGASPFRAAVDVPRYGVAGMLPYDYFIRMDTPAIQAQTTVLSYARYWHGFLVFLKPLSTVLAYDAIRTLNLILQTVLLCAIILLMFKRKLAWYLPPLLLSVCFLTPQILHLSLQFSSVTYVTLLTTLCLLLFGAGDKGQNVCPIIMLLSGIVTAYVDLLTFPMLSFTVPLVFVWMLRSPKRRDAKGLLSDLSLCAACWMVGYAGMWAGKWLIVRIVLGETAAADILSVIRFRSGTDYLGHSMSRILPLQKNLRLIVSQTYPMLLAAAYLAYLGARAWRRARLPRVHGGPRQAPACLALLAIALVPAIWILFTANHAAAHDWYTYRNVVGSVFALLTLCACLCKRAAVPAAPTENG